MLSRLAAPMIRSSPIASGCQALLLSFLSSDDDGHGPPQYIKSHALFLQPSAIKKGLKVDPKPPWAAYRVRMLILGASSLSDGASGSPPDAICSSTRVYTASSSYAVGGGTMFVPPHTLV